MDNFNFEDKSDADEWDLIEHLEEKNTVLSTTQKDATTKSLRIAVRESGGFEKKAKGLLKSSARIQRTYKCAGIFLAFKIKQLDKNAKNVKAYTTGEADWSLEYSVNLSLEYQRQADRTGGIMTKEGMQRTYGKWCGTIQDEVKRLIQERIGQIMEQIEGRNPAAQGKTRPEVVPEWIKLAPCNCTFDTAEEYNDHCEQLHGVETKAVQRDAAPVIGGGPDASMANIAASFSQMANSNTLAMNSMALQNSNATTMHRILSEPSRKDIEDGIKELMVNLETFAQIKSTSKEIPLNYHGMAQQRIFELIDESEHLKLKAAYHRKTEKYLERQHVINIESLKASLRELININTTEKEAKILYAMKLQNSDSFGDQKDYVKRQAGKFISSKYKIEGTNGVQETNKVLEIMALGHIIANIPQDMDGMLKSRIRTLLLPTMDGIHDFDSDKAVTEIKAYEKKTRAIREEKILRKCQLRRCAKER